MAVPPPPTPPDEVGPLCLRLLADAGGISSITEVLRRVQGLRKDISRSQIAKIMQRNPNTRALGAGYYCFVEMEFIPVGRWLHNWLMEEGEHSTPGCVKAICSHYPNGDPDKIRLWLLRGVPQISTGWKGYRAKGWRQRI